MATQEHKDARYWSEKENRRKEKERLFRSSTLDVRDVREDEDDDVNPEGGKKHKRASIIETNAGSASSSTTSSLENNNEVSATKAEDAFAAVAIENREANDPSREIPQNMASVKNTSATPSNRVLLEEEQDLNEPIASKNNKTDDDDDNDDDDDARIDLAMRDSHKQNGGAQDRGKEKDTHGLFPLEDSFNGVPNQRKEAVLGSGGVGDRISQNDRSDQANSESFTQIELSSSPPSISLLGSSRDKANGNEHSNVPAAYDTRDSGADKNHPKDRHSSVHKGKLYESSETRHDHEEGKKHVYLTDSEGFGREDPSSSALYGGGDGNGEDAELEISAQQSSMAAYQISRDVKDMVVLMQMEFRLQMKQITDKIRGLEANSRKSLEILEQTAGSARKSRSGSKVPPPNEILRYAKTRETQTSAKSAPQRWKNVEEARKPGTKNFDVEAGEHLLSSTTPPSSSPRVNEERDDMQSPRHERGPNDRPSALDSREDSGSRNSADYENTRPEEQFMEEMANDGEDGRLVNSNAGAASSCCCSIS